MDNFKNDEYYAARIIDDLSFITRHMMTAGFNQSRISF